MKTDITFDGGTDKQKAFARALVERGAKALAGKEPLQASTRATRFLREWMVDKCCVEGVFDAERIVDTLKVQLASWHAANVINYLKHETAEGLGNMLRFSWAEVRAQEIAKGVNVAPLHEGERVEYQGMLRGKEARLRACVNMEPFAVNSLQYKTMLVFTMETWDGERWVKKVSAPVGCGSPNVTRSNYDAISGRRAGELMAEFADDGGTSLLSDTYLSKAEYKNRACVARKEA